MKLKHDIEHELLTLAVAALTAAGAEPARLAKAQELVEAKKVRRDMHYTGDGWAYLVASSAGAASYSTTSTSCTCADFSAHAGQAPTWHCKHRLACYLFRRVIRDLDKLATSSIPHHHLCVGGAHTEGEAYIECWEEMCPTRQTIVCEACIHSMFCEPQQTQEAHIVQYEGRSYRLNNAQYNALCHAGADVAERRCTSDEAMYAVLLGAGLLSNDDGGVSLEKATLPRHEDRQQYEPNPHPQWEPCKHEKVRQGQYCPNGCGFRQGDGPPPFPEAAASLTMKVPLRGGGDILYTLRGHTDEEVQRRAEAVLGWLLRHAPQRCQDQYDH